MKDKKKNQWKTGRKPKEKETKQKRKWQEK